MSAGLQQEWLALQGQHERYEGLALGVKLVAFAATVLVPDNTLAMLLLALLWLQEAVLKTFQARLGERLLAIEAGCRCVSKSLGADAWWWTGKRNCRPVTIERTAALDSSAPPALSPSSTRWWWW